MDNFSRNALTFYPSDNHPYAILTILKDVLLSLTLVTFFFETSKPQANIYYALVGLECQA
jgi:hypothetical protein